MHPPDVGLTGLLVRRRKVEIVRRGGPHFAWQLDLDEFAMIDIVVPEYKVRWSSAASIGEKVPFYCGPVARGAVGLIGESKEPNIKQLNLLRRAEELRDLQWFSMRRRKFDKVADRGFVSIAELAGPVLKNPKVLVVEVGI
jgi:hypothetical protein